MDTFEVNNSDYNGVTVIRAAESNEMIHLGIFNNAVEYMATEIGINVDKFDKGFNSNYKEDISELTVSNLLNVIKETRSIFSDVNHTLTDEKVGRVEKIIQDMESYSEALNRIFDYTHSDSFRALIPNFVYFSSFDDIIPDSISRNEEIKPIVKRFSKW
ncbi:hypothetical protein [Paenibacillus sp. TC-CSREp1]|uniref:hypothetical protein n=1 Tax=Paenibacillus sp. TC-CSREp1 TaxID=3410089 RepID=UPI003CF214BD